MNIGKRSPFKIVFLLLLFLTFISCNQTRQDEKRTRILLIHSFAQLDTGYVEFNKLLHEKFEKNSIKADLHIHYLNSEVLPSQIEEQVIYQFVESEQSWKPDLILTVDDQASYSLLACKHPFVKTVPVIFAGVNFPNWDLYKQYPNVTGYYNTPDYKANIQLIEQIMGKMYLTVNYDRFYLGKKVHQLLLSQISSLPIKIDYQPLNQWQKLHRAAETTMAHSSMRPNELLNIRPDSTIISFVNFQEMTAGYLFRSYNSGDMPYRAFLNLKYDFTSSFFASRQKTLAFTAMKEGFGYSGFLAGYFTSQRIVAEDLTLLAAEILNGKQVKDIPFRESRKEYVFDWKEMKRWNVTPSQLPPHAVIVNMPPYERYHLVFILTIAVIILAVVGLILYLVRLYIREQQRKIQEQRQKEDALNALKLKQEDLQFALAKAQESDQMKSVFLANMSHEIRTPLNAIIGFTSILTSDMEIDKEEKNGFTTLINQNCDLLLKLINDILDLARIESGQMLLAPVTCNLTDILQSMYRTHLLVMRTGIELRKNFPPQPAILHIDPHRLTQVITNFINNAAKFTENGYIEIGYFYDEQTISVYIEDTGKGIAEEKQQAIFSRFTKVDEFVQGAGLGLSICKAIAESMSGIIEVESKVGQGSRFTIKFPYTLANPE